MYANLTKLEILLSQSAQDHIIPSHLCNIPEVLYGCHVWRSGWLFQPCLNHERMHRDTVKHCCCNTSSARWHMNFKDDCRRYLETCREDLLKFLRYHWMRSKYAPHDYGANTITNDIFLTYRVSATTDCVRVRDHGINQNRNNWAPVVSFPSLFHCSWTQNERGGLWRGVGSGNRWGGCSQPSVSKERCKFLVVLWFPRVRSGCDLSLVTLLLVTADIGLAFNVFTIHFEHCSSRMSGIHIIEIKYPIRWASSSMSLYQSTYVE